MESPGSSEKELPKQQWIGHRPKALMSSERGLSEQLRNGIFPPHGIDDSRGILQGVGDSQGIGYVSEHVLSETDGKGLSEPEI
jgi:hypothetical protein